MTHSANFHEHTGHPNLKFRRSLTHGLTNQSLKINQAATTTQKQMLTATPKQYVTPQPADILAGRSHRAFSHRGNITLRFRIVERLDEYKKCTSRKQKTRIIRRLTEQISEEGGRFIRLDKESQQWYDAGFKEAHMKISHSFRDAAVPNKVKCLSGLKASLKTSLFHRNDHKASDDELQRPQSPASLPDKPVSWKPVRFRCRSCGHFDDLSKHDDGESLSLDLSSVPSEDFPFAQPGEPFRLNDMEPVVNPPFLLGGGGEIVLKNYDYPQTEFDQVSLYDHVKSTVFCEMPETLSQSRNSCGREIESCFPPQELTGEDEYEGLNQLRVADLSISDFDVVLDDLDIDGFSW